MAAAQSLGVVIAAAAYRTNRAVAWLMGIGYGLWIVRYRNKASKPMKLPAAKKYAVETVKGIRPGRVVTDPIGDLNTMAAALIGANNDWLPPVEPELVEYIREVETGWVRPSEAPRAEMAA
jgi:hypothetical protein